MERELGREAREAMTAAAERLGVDPYRLARFLSGGRLADVLLGLRGPGADQRETIRLAESYLAFLDDEIQMRDGSGRASKRGS